MEFASSQVSSMQQELRDLQPQLEQAQVTNATMMEQINKESKEAAEIEVIFFNLIIRNANVHINFSQ